NYSVFFFSSRRRHTRSKRDWSSDVCSSDLKEIFIRVVDPKGNLIADPKKVFYVHGEKLQYTQKENINFTNNGEEYTLYWEDPNGFRKGAYTILLYSDDAIMGRSSVVLR